MHVYDLPDIWKDELNAAGVGCIQPTVKMIVKSRYSTGVDSRGVHSWSSDFKTVEIDLTHRLIDGVSITLSTPILPADGLRDNVLRVSPITFTVANFDEIWGIVQSGSILDKSAIETARVIVTVNLNDAPLIMPLWQGTIDNTPTELPGKTEFTARHDLFDALTSPVLFERFNPIKQWAELDRAGITYGTYNSSKGNEYYAGVVYFDEEGAVRNSLRMDSGTGIKLKRVKVKNKAKPGKYSVEFVSQNQYKLSHPGGTPIYSDTSYEIDTDFIQIKAENFYGSDIYGTIQVNNVGFSALETVIIRITEPSGTVINLATFTYSSGPATKESIAKGISDVINAGTASHGYNAVQEYDLIYLYPPTPDFVYMNYTITAAVGTTGIIIGQFVPRGDNSGSVIDFQVYHSSTGNPVAIALNLLEKGITKDHGNEPARAASLPIDWASFEAVESYFSDVVIYADFTNDNSAWNRESGNYPVNTLAAAQKCLDHIGAKIAIDTMGVIRCVDPGVLDAEIYEITDDMILSGGAAIPGYNRKNFYSFQYGGNSGTNTTGPSIEYDESGGGNKKNQVINLPFLKSGKNDADIAVISQRWMDYQIRPGGRFNLNLKPNWGLPIRPGDRLLLNMQEAPRYAGFVQVYEVSMEIGGPVLVKAFAISGLLSDGCPLYDVDLYDVAVYCE